MVHDRKGQPMLVVNFDEKTTQLFKEVRVPSRTWRAKSYIYILYLACFAANVSEVDTPYRALFMALVLVWTWKSLPLGVLKSLLGPSSPLEATFMVKSTCHDYRRHGYRRLFIQVRHLQYLGFIVTGGDRTGNDIAKIQRMASKAEERYPTAVALGGILRTYSQTRCDQDRAYRLKWPKPCNWLIIRHWFCRFLSLPTLVCCR